MTKPVQHYRLPHLPWNLPEDFSLRFMYRYPQAIMGEHSHDFIEIVIIDAGSGLHEDAGGRTPLIPGSVLCLSPGQWHAYPVSDGLLLHNICFSTALRRVRWFREVMTIGGMSGLVGGGEVRRFNLPVEVLPDLRDLLARLNAELVAQSPGYEVVARAMFTQIMACICRHSPWVKQPQGRGMWRILPVIQYFEQHYDQPVSLEDAAAGQGMSKANLIRRFREATGVTPLDYLIQTRLQKAAGLFCDPGLSITKVAFMVGFSDSNYFTRQFRKRFGISPREYRRKLGSRS